jgi:hypothetical protein
VNQRFQLEISVCRPANGARGSLAGLCWWSEICSHGIGVNYSGSALKGRIG